MLQSQSLEQIQVFYITFRAVSCRSQNVPYHMQPHASTQVAEKTPFNRAMSYMNLEEAIEDDGVSVRAPPCKKPRKHDELVRDLEVPNGVGDQTVSCPTNGVYVPHKMFVHKYSAYSAVYLYVHVVLKSVLVYM